MSQDLSWMVIRRNHSYLMKRRDVKQPFSTEPMNLKNLHSFRYNGLVRKRAIGIQPAPDKKGIVLSYKTKQIKRYPAKGIVKVPYKQGARTVLNRVRRFIRFNRYRKDLKMAALRKASAILESQKPPVIKKAGRKKPE